MLVIASIFKLKGEDKIMNILVKRKIRVKIQKQVEKIFDFLINGETKPKKTLKKKDSKTKTQNKSVLNRSKMQKSHLK